MAKRVHPNKRCSLQQRSQHFECERPVFFRIHGIRHLLPSTCCPRAQTLREFKRTWSHVHAHDLWNHLCIWIPRIPMKEGGRLGESTRFFSFELFVSVVWICICRNSWHGSLSQAWSTAKKSEICGIRKNVTDTCYYLVAWSSLWDVNYFGVLGIVLFDEQENPWGGSTKYEWLFLGLQHSIKI